MTLVVCFLSFHYVLVYLLNYEFVDVWFLSQLYLKLGPGFNSILVPTLHNVVSIVKVEWNYYQATSLLSSLSNKIEYVLLELCTRPSSREVGE